MITVVRLLVHLGIVRWVFPCLVHTMDLESGVRWKSHAPFGAGERPQGPTYRHSARFLAAREFGEPFQEGKQMNVAKNNVCAFQPSRTVKRLWVSMAEVVWKHYWFLQRDFEKLELYEVKVSRTVPRGRGAGNSTLLPDSMTYALQKNVVHFREKIF